MVQHMQISQHDAEHKEIEGEKTYNYLYRCRKSVDKIKHPLMIKILNKVM